MKNNGQLILSINIAALIVLLDLSAINIALPSLKTHFDLNVIQVSGILMSSMMMASGTALIMGRFTEQFSPKSILSIAFIIFGSSSLLTAFCTQFSTIIILRLIQGIAESALYVSGPAMIKKLLPAQSHQKEFGKWMMSCGIGISLGPILGGFLIHWFQWQAVFLINVPLSLFGLYFA